MAMVTQITRGIKISVLTSFEGSYFKNYKIHFAFSYQITIENHSKDSVQLITRHWEIFDALNEIEIVDGEGVIGKKPVLKPGETHTYSSGCLLSSPFGAMKGHFNMINFTSTRNFRVIVPNFRLSAPFALN
jgi:ApaG protein